jgi:hypothetical protein
MRNIALADYRAQKDEKTLNQTMKSLKTFVDANVRNSRTRRMCDDIPGCESSCCCCIFYRCFYSITLAEDAVGRRS